MPLDRLGDTVLGGMKVTVIDPVADYAELMERVFDFDRLRDLSAAASGCASTRCRRWSPAPMRFGSSSVGWARPPARVGGQAAYPSPISAAVIPIQTRNPIPCRSGRRGTGGRGRALSRRRLGRRRRPQPDRRAQSRRRPERQPRRARRQRPAGPVVRQGPVRGRALDADLSRRRVDLVPPRHSASRASEETSTGWQHFAAFCPMPVGSGCAAKRVRAPALTICAKKMGYGRCCSGSA